VIIDVGEVILWGLLSRVKASPLDTAQLDTTNHSDRCLEAFHCSSVVSGSCPIDSCPNGGHPNSGKICYGFIPGTCLATQNNGEII